MRLVYLQLKLSRKKIDICYECQKKMAALLKLMPNVEINSSGNLKLGD